MGNSQSVSHNSVTLLTVTVSQSVNESLTHSRTTQSKIILKIYYTILMIYSIIYWLVHSVQTHSHSYHDQLLNSLIHWRWITHSLTFTHSESDPVQYLQSSITNQSITNMNIPFLLVTKLVSLTPTSTTTTTSTSSTKRINIMYTSIILTYVNLIIY